MHHEICWSQFSPSTLLCIWHERRGVHDVRAASLGIIFASMLEIAFPLSCLLNAIRQRVSSHATIQMPKSSIAIVMPPLLNADV